MLTACHFEPPPSATTPPDQRVLVFILAGQSNMEGQAVVDLDGPDYNDGRGTLRAVLADPTIGPRFAHLRTSTGAFATRDDVFVRYQHEDGTLQRGPLGVGYTVYQDRHHFGPELQFGHVLGDATDRPVLLIKTAWGGKSLHRDFRPPSAGGEVGPYYERMIDEVRAALIALPQEFPDLAPRGVELAGLVWYQGWNDGCDPEHAVPAYEDSLVHLIHDVRADLLASDLPVVVGELTGPWRDAPGEWDRLRTAQRAATQRPELLGTVAFAPTREFVRDAAASPNPGHGHHEFGNAETCLLVGEALAQAMLALRAETARDEAARFAHLGAEARRSPTDLAAGLRRLPPNDRNRVLALAVTAAQQLFQNGDHAGSRDLNHAIALVADTADAWNNYAYLCRETQQFAKAEAGYERALQREPESPQLLNSLGVLLHHHAPSPTNRQRARSLYQRAIERGLAWQQDPQRSDADRQRAATALANARTNLQQLDD